NVARVAAIHHPLRDIDSYTGDVRSVIDILDLIDRAAMHAHAQTNSRVVSHRPRYFQRALDRFFRRLEKDHRHPVTGRDADEFTAALTLEDLRSPPDSLNRVLE